VQRFASGLVKASPDGHSGIAYVGTTALAVALFACDPGVQSASDANPGPDASPPVQTVGSNWKNIYGIAWRDPRAEGVARHVSYAKQMGYDGVAIYSDWAPLWKSNPDKAGLAFYLMDPERFGDHFYGHVPTGPTVKRNRAYTQAEKDWYEENMVWKSNAPFPDNLATSFFFNASDFSTMWDYQQQRVIDLLVGNIVQIAHSYEDTGFTFGGVMYDMARIDGHFTYWNPGTGGNVATGLSHWRGSDSSALHGSITHEYATFSDGKAAFYKQLQQRLKEEFGSHVKWIIQPGFIYSTVPYMDEWVYHVESRSDYAELLPDLYIVENDALNSFLTEPRIFSSRLGITEDMVGSAVHHDTLEGGHRSLAGNIGIKGAWFNWFGRFEETLDFVSIMDVWPRLKLIRCIPAWDNLHEVPLGDRSWNGTVYESTKNGRLQSHIDPDVMYSRHPKNGNLFAVFNTTQGIINLHPGEVVTDVQSVDALFMEAGSAFGDFDSVNGQIVLKSSVVIERHTDGQTKGRGYIFTIGP